MTTEEWAHEVVSKWLDNPNEYELLSVQDCAQLEGYVSVAITAAVAEERERCAKIAFSFWVGGKAPEDHYGRIAAAIREGKA